MSQSQEQGRIKVYHALVENELSTQLKKKEHLIIELINCFLRNNCMCNHLNIGQGLKNTVYQNMIVLITYCRIRS